MKGKHDIRTENLAKKELNVIKRDVVIFGFFLFLSFSFWYLNSLGKETEASIRYQVKYTNIPKKRVITDEPPAKLNLYLRGTGFSILKLRFSGRRESVEIDISKVNYMRVPGSKSISYYIVTSGLTKSFNVQLRSGCEITSIKPDTLFFTLEKEDAKSVEVTPD